MVSIRAILFFSVTAAAGRCILPRSPTNCRSQPWSFLPSREIFPPSACYSPMRASIHRRLLSAFARLKQPDVARLPRAAIPTETAQTRKIFIGNSGGWLDAKIYHRDALEPGFTAAGPAVIEEYGSTTVVWPGDKFAIGSLREITISCSAK